MKIIKESKTIGGRECIEFLDSFGNPCKIWIDDDQELFFDLIRDFFKLSQDHVKELLPYLQAYAESGALIPETES
jgi:hypothetical protein